MLDGSVPDGHSYKSWVEPKQRLLSAVICKRKEHLDGLHCDDPYKGERVWRAGTPMAARCADQGISTILCESQWEQSLGSDAQAPFSVAPAAATSAVSATSVTVDTSVAAASTSATPAASATSNVTASPEDQTWETSLEADTAEAHMHGERLREDLGLCADEHLPDPDDQFVFDGESDGDDYYCDQYGE